VSKKMLLFVAVQARSRIFHEIDPLSAGLKIRHSCRRGGLATREHLSMSRSSNCTKQILSATRSAHSLFLLEAGGDPRSLALQGVPRENPFAPAGKVLEEKSQDAFDQASCHPSKYASTRPIFLSLQATTIVSYVHRFSCFFDTCLVR
jgi:hypothetical protein